MTGKIWKSESGLMWNLTVFETNFYNKSMSEFALKIAKETLKKLDSKIKEQK